MIFQDGSLKIRNESPLSPPRYYSDDSNDSLPNSVDSSCRIKSNDKLLVPENYQEIHPKVEMSKEKDKLRIKELESEIQVLQVYLLQRKV